MDRQRIGKMLLFVRGTKVVYLISRINDGSDMMSIARAIDEAILADAEEYRKANGKDGSQ